MTKPLPDYHRIKFIGLLLLTASLPLHIHISSVLIGALTLLTLCRKFFGVTVPFRWRDFSVLAWLTLAYFALEAISLLYTDSANLSVGLARLEQHQALVLFPLIFIDVSLDEKQLDKLLAALTASCLVMAIVAVVINIRISVAEYGTAFHQWRFSHDRISEVIGLQAVYFALYLSVSMVAILRWLIMGSFKRGIKRLLLVLAVSFSVLIVALGARMVIAALVLVMLVNLVYYARKLSNKWLLVAAGVLPLIFALLILTNPIVTTRFADLLKSNKEDLHYGSFFARTEIWKPGAEVIAENLWLGVGIGDEQKELDNKFAKVGYDEGVGVFNMHNAYMQTMLSIGVSGVLVLLAILAIQYYRALTVRNILYVSFLLIFSIASITESTLNRNKGVVFFLLFSFLFYALASQPKARHDHG